MASLVTQTELETLLGETLDADVAALLLNTASGVVRGVVGQELSAVTDDVLSIMGTTSVWLLLPQRPVTAVTAVELDGDALTSGTDYKRFGSRLWRAGGWRTCPSEPTAVQVTYSHGYAAGDWRLETARSMVLTLAANKVKNPGAVESEAVDDYRVRYAVTATDLPEHARANLIEAYASEAGHDR
jgi:hypothetical protein